jgi:iron complex outermembrane receptor protein
MFKLPKLFRFLLPISAVVLAATGFTSVAQAQGADQAIEEIITTGTRRADRSASDASVPIDVIGGQEMENQGLPDMDDMLRNTIPSYNVQRISIGDAATLIRPATLRGLPPDNNLVLVNGKRRHRAAVISESGALVLGAQGADLAAIPGMAIKQVEVLRDGASAQYGSDAIAGVLNFVLRDDADGFSVEARTGEFFEGDGTMVQISGNAGFHLGDDGFANVTVQWREQDPTSRSTQRTDAATLIRSGNAAQQANVRTPAAQVWGAPEIIDDLNIFLNAGVQLTDSQELYFFGNYGERQNEGGFFYRNPNNRGGTYTDGGVRIVADTDIIPGVGGQVSTCPALLSPGSGANGVDLDPVLVAADELAMASMPANCWLMNFEAPGGYTPAFGGVMTDTSAAMGIRGEMDNGLLYDFSGNLGRNEVEFYLGNTWNPSNGPDGQINGALQRSFELGSYTETDTNLNADFVLPIAVDAFASDLNFAFGAEWRNEQFQTRIGEEASWNAGDYAFQNADPFNPNFYNDGVTEMRNLSIGAHGFAGFSPPQAGRWDRANYAAYVDLEADVTERLTLGAAVRFEDFEDFGTTTNYKVSGRFAFTDALAVRGSYSTGFRAPTPGQNNVTKVSTLTIEGELVQNGQIPPSNPIAVSLGASELRPEDATNFTFGAVWDMTDTISLTVDYYNIELKDRIAQTGSIDITAEPPLTDGSCPTTALDPNGTLSECLQESGVPGAADLTSVRFFTNDFESTTQGIDVVASWSTDWGNAGNGNLTAAYNWTETTIDRVGEEVDRNRVHDLENELPQHRGIFTYNHFIGDLRLMGRASYYGEWADGGFSGDPSWTGPGKPNYTQECVGTDLGGGLRSFNDHCYDGEWIFDIEASYTFAEKYSIMVGVQNLADTFGPLNKGNADGLVRDGDTYAGTTPWGFDGGFWYFRLRADFD